MFVSNRQHVIILRQESEAELEDRLSEENKNILHNGYRDDTKFTKKCLCYTILSLLVVLRNVRCLSFWTDATRLMWLTSK